jgi:hypothetical protein
MSDKIRYVPVAKPVLVPGVPICGRMQLTAKLVATLVKRPGRYHDGHGLILVVVNPNNASWQLR